MEWHVEQARELVERMQEEHHPVGKMEAAYVIQYAFYAGDFTQVTKLAVELARRGYERKHGILDKEFLAPYDAEMQQKKEHIRKFVMISEQAAQMLEEGNRLLEKMQDILTELGLSKSYGDYRYQQAEEKRRMETEQKEMPPQQEPEGQTKPISERGNGRCQR